MNEPKHVPVLLKECIEEIRKYLRDLRLTAVIVLLCHRLLRSVPNTAPGTCLN